MKRILLSMLTCSIGLSVIAQIDSSKKISPGNSDKWVITPVKNMKGMLGQLDMNFPAGLDWNIGNLAITRESDEKYITSFSGIALRTKKSYNMAPGEYLIHLNNLPIENVPIQKGQVTKLKVGILKITAEDRWEIYNETKEKYLTSYNKPLRFVAPVGKYILSINGQDRVIVIEEGKTIEGTNMEIAEERPSVYEKWVTTPAKSFRKGEGVLNNDFPGATSFDGGITELTSMVNFLKVDATIYAINSGPIYLYPGEHRIRVNNIVIENLPISENTETRLKAGYLNIRYETGQEQGNGWTLFDRTRTTAYRGSIYPQTLLLPVGVYSIRYHLGEDWDSITIRDRETEEFIIPKN